MSLLKSGTSLQLSLKPGRTGWLVKADCSLEELRISWGKWLERATCLHAPSGRYFCQPNNRYFIRALPAVRPESWTTTRFYQCPQRQDRRRRLEQFLSASDGRGRNNLGYPIFRRLALRLDFLPRSQKPDTLWRFIGDDFDELWRTVPLFAVHLSPFQQRILTLLAATV